MLTSFSFISLLFCLIAFSAGTALCSSSCFSELPTPPGASYGFAMNGRVWWHKLKETDRFPVGSFDYSGVTFTAVSVGGGEMNLTSIAIKFSVMTSRDSTRNQPHFFKAFLHEYDSAAQLPDQWDFIPPPTTASSLVSVVNFSTASWENGTIVEQKLFEKDQINPLKTYICSVVKITEPNFNRRVADPNYLTFYDFILTRNLETSLKVQQQQLNFGSQIRESKKKRRRVEFLGDSLECGYCNLGYCHETTWYYNASKQNNTCASKEDFTKTWEFLASDRLRASYQVTSWSGIGLVAWYNHSRENTHFTGPKMFQRAVATNSAWNWPFSKMNQNKTEHVEGFLPDALVIDLGTNDFAATHTVNDTNFTNAWIATYKKLISNVSQTLGKELRQTSGERLLLVIACGPWPYDASSDFCPLLFKLKTHADQHFSNYLNTQVLHFPTLPEKQTSCDHPDVEGDAATARVFERFLTKHLGWKN